MIVNNFYIHTFGWSDILDDLPTGFRYLSNDRDESEKELQF